PAYERRQPPRRRGPDDPGVREDARVDRQVPLAVGALLGVALPDRAQPRDGPLPREQALAARGGGPRARPGRAERSRGGGARVDRSSKHARDDREALARAAAGPHAEVRLQLLERGGGDDPRQDRGRDQVASAPRARFAAAAAPKAVERSAMALSVGIVGLPNSGKTTLFKGLTRTGASVPGKENVGMAAIPDA